MRAFSACNSLGSIRLDAKVHRESLPNQSSHSHRGEIQQPANDTEETMRTFEHRGATKKRLLECIFALMALVFTTAAQAQAWPARNASIVVPYPPGSGPDVLARALADRLVSTTGKPVIVENRAGANAIIGS